MRWSGNAAILALLLVPAAAMGQQGNPAGPPADAGVSPLERVLQRRAELALTPQQVQKLEAIQRESADQERALRAKIVETRGAAPGVPLRTHAAAPAERQVLHEKMVAVRPHMSELRQLHLRQMQEARAVLTAEQNARAWDITRPHAGGRTHPGMGPGRQAHPGPGRQAHPGPGRQPHGRGVGPDTAH